MGAVDDVLKVVEVDRYAPVGSVRLAEEGCSSRLGGGMTRGPLEGGAAYPPSPTANSRMLLTKVNVHVRWPAFWVLM